MDIDVRELLKEDVGASTAFEFKISDPAVDDVRAKDLTLKGTATLLEDQLLVQGSGTVIVTLECIRCLKDFELPLTLEFAETFSEQPEDDQFGFTEAAINLTEMIRTLIFLAVPDRPVHDPACKGICDQCGKDLNQEPHTHDKPKPEDDNPFKALEKLKKD